MTDFTVKVTGLAELGRAFRKVDAEVPAELKVRFLSIAEGVAAAIRGKVPTLSGKAAGSVKAKASTWGASIASGGTAAPYFPWLDYGGNVGRANATHRPFMSGGRYVYPTIAEHGDATKAAVEDAIEDVARKAGFEVRG